MIRWLLVLLLALAPAVAQAQFTPPAMVSVSHGSSAACPDDDGSAGATAGTANFPALLSGYAATINGVKGLGCKVAGVDYRVGLVAAPTLKDPTVDALPAGVTYNAGNGFVVISNNNTTFDGWDMSKAGGLLLEVASGVTGTIIKNNKFVVQSPVCNPPMWFPSLAGTTTVKSNSIDGGGAACAGSGLAFGFSADVYIQNTDTAGATFIYEWNDQENISEDGINVVGPPSGTPLTFIQKYNLFYKEGWGGHPDGTQFAGGIITAPVQSHNTYYNPVFVGGTAGTQPFHVEAQLSSTISNAVVSYNTILTPGTCTAFPTNCSANVDIDCKWDDNDPGANSNTGFSAYGNYIDWSGAIAALAKPTTGGGKVCTGTSWGAPNASNYDMVAGTVLSAP